jgi:hypothetical protein
MTYEIFVEVVVAIIRAVIAVGSMLLLGVLTRILWEVYYLGFTFLGFWPV